MTILLGLVTLLSAFGQFGRIELPFARALYGHEILLVLWCVLALYRERTVLFVWLLRSHAIRWLIVLDLWILLGIGLWMRPMDALATSSLLYLARIHLYLLFAVLLPRFMNKKQILFGIVSWVVCVALFGIIQYVFVPDVRPLQYVGWDDHYKRLIGTFFDPGFTGAILAIGAVFIQHRLNKRHHIILLAVVLCGVLLTYSRASFLAYLTGTGVLWLQTKKIKHVMIATLFIVGIFFLPRSNSEGTLLERTASVSARVENATGTLQSLTPKQLLVGRGWYNYRTLDTLYNQKEGIRVPNHASAPDNSFLFFLSSLGIVGCIFLGIWLYQLWWGRQEQIFYVLLITWSVAACFANALVYPFLLFMMGALTAYTRRSTP